jgi:DNA-binding protein YbaB
MNMNDILANAINNAVEHEEEVHSGLTGTHESLPPKTVVDEPQIQVPPTRPSVSVKGLDEKAVLISVKRRMYSPYKLDQEESKKYGAGNVNKHLFEGRNNKVKETISKFSEVYVYVKENTVPWSTGVDMLNIDHYMEFTQGLRQLVDQANQAVWELYSKWDDEVTADLDRLAQIAIAKGKPNLANPSDYPSADEMRTKFSIDVRYMPVPTTGDFRVGISDEDKESLQQQLDDAGSNATKHVLESMITPMRRAIEKLAVPIGNDGSVFRDTLIDNMVDVAERMNKVNISDDPAIQAKIDDLRSLVGTYANNKDMLRDSQTVREKAVSQIDSLVSQMANLV